MIQKFTQIWSDFMAADRVIVDPEKLAAYARNCSGAERKILAVVAPIDAEEVSAIVGLARKLKTPLYPVSCGRNWGYGSAAPVQNDCVIVDLSRLNRILSFDRASGLVTLEPGVTQKQLSDFLKKNDDGFLVPTTGAGPQASILGNALERGFGITPNSDHFAAVMAVEAILPDGSHYRSPFAEMGAPALDQSFKWKIGPYLDGIFTQGNFGIVTRMTIALAKKPECVTAFYLQIPQEELLEAAVEVIRGIMQDFGANVGGVNLMNGLRILSMDQRAPEAARREGRAVSIAEAAALFARRKISPWTCVGTIYGTREVAAAVQKGVSKRLKKIGLRPIFMNRSRVEWIKRIVLPIPLIPKQYLLEHLEKVETSLRLFEGEPGAVALKLVHWRSENEAPQATEINPDAGDIGLLWYAPVFPMHPDSARELTKVISRVLPKYGFDPLITYTAFSDRCLDCTVPILYNSKRAGEAERARACYEEIFEEGRKLGAIPYRAGVQFMDQVVDPEKPFWRLQNLIKNAIDPDHIIAPGRYSVVSTRKIGLHKRESESSRKESHPSP